MVRSVSISRTLNFFMMSPPLLYSLAISLLSEPNSGVPSTKSLVEIVNGRSDQLVHPPLGDRSNRRLGVDICPNRNVCKSFSDKSNFQCSEMELNCINLPDLARLLDLDYLDHCRPPYTTKTSCLILCRKCLNQLNNLMSQEDIYRI